MEKFSAKILKASSNQGCVRDGFSEKTGKVNVQSQALVIVTYSEKTNKQRKPVTSNLNITKC